MRLRNPAAVCGNCPYGVLSTMYERPHIECRRYGVAQDGFPLWYPETWCGEHPDFWVEEGVELITVLEHANGLLADLRKRHERLRAHMGGLVEKVRELRPPMTMTVACILGVPKCGCFTEEMVAAWEKCREAVLEILDNNEENSQ